MTDESAPVVTLAFDGPGLLLCANYNFVSAFALGHGADPVAAFGSGECAGRFPSVGFRPRHRVVTVVPLSRSSDVAHAAVVGQSSLSLFDLEEVDEIDPQPVVAAEVDRAKLGRVACAARLPGGFLAAGTSQGHVLLWDARCRAPVCLNVPHPSNAVGSFGRPRRAEEYTAICAGSAEQILVGTGLGSVLTFDLRAAGGGAVATMALPPLLSAATSGRIGGDQPQLVARLKVEGAALAPGQAHFSTLCGFVGIIDLADGRLAAGTYSRDGTSDYTIPDFAVSPVSSLIVCPRPGKHSVSLLNFAPAASASLRFAVPVTHATVHPEGEIAAGVFAADISGHIWSISLHGHGAARANHTFA
jgi:hypothetical protein